MGKCIRDKEMQRILRELYDRCETEELLKSIAGGEHMAKILVRFANGSIWDDILHYKDAVIESDKEAVIVNILSAAKAPKYDGKGNKTGNILTGHILYREAEMTFSRKAFLKIFENKDFTQLVYR